MSVRQLNHILELMAQNPPPQSVSPPVLRAWVEEANSHTPIAANVDIQRVRCGPCEGDLLLPQGGDPTRLIIYYHGGGFVFCSSRTHRVTASNLARVAGCAVLAPDYRLAPEHPAPAAHDDAYDVYRWALDQGYAADGVALAGDSAGANLALATAIRARDAGLPTPSALALLSPWLDFAEDGGAYTQVLDDPILTPSLMDYFKAAYLGDHDVRSPLVTPFYADFTGLPPTIIHAASRERVRDDAVTVARRLMEAGVATEFKIYQDMIHTWQMFAPFLDEGMEAIETCGEFIKARQGTAVETEPA